MPLRRMLMVLVLGRHVILQEFLNETVATAASAIPAVGQVRGIECLGGFVVVVIAIAEQVKGTGQDRQRQKPKNNKTKHHWYPHIE